MAEARPALSYVQAVDAARVALEANLPAVCRELLAWHDTGLLPDGRLREAAAILEPVAPGYFLQIAEGMANRAALKHAAQSQSDPGPCQSASPALESDR
ncbi:hypothetical protein [Roseomonas sp. USHLN139]|uniref:hypothetical protein n=1 Tax=Roseomonas sp. USHLN139 TaxID=3081298 RepID=UPI003B023113